jgi:hypothetical protein
MILNEDIEDSMRYRKMKKSFLERLFESVLHDINRSVKAYLQDESNQDLLIEEITAFLKILKSLSNKGEFQKVLDNAELVIIERVLSDIKKEKSCDKNDTNNTDFC